MTAEGELLMRSGDYIMFLIEQKHCLTFRTDGGMC